MICPAGSRTYGLPDYFHSFVGHRYQRDIGSGTYRYTRSVRLVAVPTGFLTVFVHS